MILEHRATFRILFLIVFIDLVGFGMIIPVLPLYAERFSPSPLTFGLLMASFSIMQLVFNPILGRISDRFGRRPVLLLSLVGAAAGYALLTIADSLALLFASRIVAGIFAANIATTQAVVTDITGPEGRTKGMGIIGAAFGLGFIAGPAIGAGLDWIAPWLPGAFAATTSLVAFGLAYVKLPETRGATTDVQQARAPVDAEALREASQNTALALCMGAVLLLIVAFASFEVTFAQFLSRRLDLDPETERGKIYLLFVYAGILGAFVQGGLVGRLSKRISETKLVLAGSAIAAVSFFLLPLAQGIGATLAVLALLALGQGITNPSLSSLVSGLVPGDRVGVALGLFQSTSSLGRVIGPLVGQWALGVGLAWPYWIAAMLDLAACAVVAGLLVVRRAPARAAPRHES